MLQNSGCGLLSSVSAASVGPEGMVSFLQITIFHAVTMCVCDFKPILVVKNHFLLEVRAGNTFPVDCVTIKHSSPLLAAPSSQQLLRSKNKPSSPSSVVCESPQIVQSDTDGIPGARTRIQVFLIAHRKLFQLYDLVIVIGYC